MASASAVVQGQLLSVALNKLTGINPIVENRSDRVYIRWTPEQQKQIQLLIEAELAKKPSKPSEIQMEIAPIVFPLIVKKAFPVVATLLIAGYIAGKVS